MFEYVRYMAVLGLELLVVQMMRPRNPTFIMNKIFECVMKIRRLIQSII